MNVFPFTVHLPDGTEHKACRIVFDGARTVVWEWNGTEPTALVVADGAPAQVDKDTLLIADPAQIAEIRATRDDGCSCSHPLKRFTPQLDDARGAQRHYVTNHDA